MKDLLNKTFKIKHLVILFILLFTLKVVMVINRPHYPRHRQVTKFEHRGKQMRNNFHKSDRTGDRFVEMKIRYEKLDNVDKQSIDSLRNLMKGVENHKDRFVIMKQIRGILELD